MAFPIRCRDWSEACDCAVERDRPIVVAVPDDGRVAIAKVYPSRDYRILRHEPEPARAKGAR